MKAYETGFRLSINYLTALFNKLPALDFATRVAGILISFPVWGFRPVRALLFVTEKVPRSSRGQLFPFFSAFITELVNAWMAFLQLNRVSIRSVLLLARPILSSFNHPISSLRRSLAVLRRPIPEFSGWAGHRRPERPGRPFHRFRSRTRDRFRAYRYL